MQAADGCRQTHVPPFFGEVAIDGGAEALTVRLRDLDGKALYIVTLDPKR
ncbi:hypothetical protein [Actinoallomurus sp. NPDC050550]